MAEAAAQAAGSAYSPEQYADNYGPGMEHHWWTIARSLVVQRAVSRFPGATILDVGCGPGLVVSHLRRAGYDCHGCDIGCPEPLEAVRGAVRTGTDALTSTPGSGPAWA